MTVSIIEVYEYLKTKGASLRKLKMKLNGFDAYEVEYSNGGFITCTELELKDRYIVGQL